MSEISMTRTCDTVPVQYEGTIGNIYFYFRARYDSWFFGVGSNVDDAIIADSIPGLFYREGNYGKQFDASYMPYSEAEQIISQCIEEYLAANNQSLE